MSSLMTAWRLRHAAQTRPVVALGPVTGRALSLAERLCWDSLSGGDASAFSRQAAVCAELHDFGRDGWCRQAGTGSP